jgi:hypothetical protein
MVILVVDAVVAGVLAGLVASAANGSRVPIALAAAPAGASYLVAWISISFAGSTSSELNTRLWFPHAAEAML